MRKATKTVATWLGIVAGIAGLEHGYFEFLQGNTRPPDPHGSQALTLVY